MRTRGRTYLTTLAVRMAHATALFATVAMAIGAQAQAPTPVATLDSTTILIGQQAHLELSVTYRADNGSVDIQWPLITDTITGHVDVLHDSHVDTVLPDRKNDPFLLKQVRTLTITAWDSGYWAIPPFRFLINGDTVESNPLLLTVNTVPVDTSQDFRDIKEIYTLPFSLLDWLRENWKPVAGGILGVAILAALIVLAYRRMKRPKPEAPPPPPQPLHIRTLLALEALQQKKLWQQGRAKDYYSGLTDIVRGYLQERYGVAAMEQTTDELLSALRFSAMPRAQQEALTPMLRLADMVKFAKWVPLPTENEMAMASAIRLVQETADPRPDAPLA